MEDESEPLPTPDDEAYDVFELGVKAIFYSWAAVSGSALS